MCSERCALKLMEEVPKHAPGSFYVVSSLCVVLSLLPCDRQVTRPGWTLSSLEQECSGCQRTETEIPFEYFSKCDGKVLSSIQLLDQMCEV